MTCAAERTLKRFANDLYWASYKRFVGTGIINKAISEAEAISAIFPRAASFKPFVVEWATFKFYEKVIELGRFATVFIVRRCNCCGKCLTGGFHTCGLGFLNQWICKGVGLLILKTVLSIFLSLHVFRCLIIPLAR